jgi:hypothetical protein
MVEAQNACWFGSVRLDDTAGDPVVAGACRALSHPTQPLDEAARELAKNLDRWRGGQTTVANVAGAGTFRVNRLRSVAESWFDCPTTLPWRRSDAICAAFPSCRSWFGIYRAAANPFLRRAATACVAAKEWVLRWTKRLPA